MKKILVFVLCFYVCVSTAVSADMPTIDAKSAVLMEASTGNIIYEQNKDAPLPPASVTKIMTMLLVMEAVDEGRLSFDDIVTASERAKSMGGSTIFLDTGEQMTVYDLMKGIAVASGNDACVAVAEHIAGSEAEFVRMMNERAVALGMKNTSFVNTNGLPAENHYTSAYDIALMSRELLRHERIFEFTTIWVDSLRGGQFGLANTNKLIRFYDGANGLKTGSTDDALYCLSATAKRDGIQLIAVIMGAPTSPIRFDGARTMLDFGFANYTIITPSQLNDTVTETTVKKGVAETVPLRCGEVFTVLIAKTKQHLVESRVEIQPFLQAPIVAGQEAGMAYFYLEGAKIGSVPLITAEAVPRKPYTAVLNYLLRSWLRKN